MKNFVLRAAVSKAFSKTPYLLEDKRIKLIKNSLPQMKMGAHAPRCLKQIKAQFHLNEEHILLSLRGFGLTSDTPVGLLREGDIVVVTADNKLKVASHQ